MAKEKSSNDVERAEPEYTRENVQFMLGQIHGLIHLAVVESDTWLVKASGDGNVLTQDDLLRALPEIGEHFGVVHAALNTGEADKALTQVGFAKAQGVAKKKGLAGAIAGVFVRTTRKVVDYVRRLRGALKWGGTIVGSVSAALSKEIERIPGASTAAEAIKEFIEVLVNATEGPGATAVDEENKQR